MDHQRTRSTIAKSSSTPVEHADSRPIEDSSFAVLRDNITEALRILVLRRWNFFVPFCLVCCVAAVASHRIPRTYESTTIIERRDHPVLMNLQQSAATGGFAMFFRPTLARDLSDPDAMVEVVKNLGLAGKLEYNADGTLTSRSLKRCHAIGARLAAGVEVRLKQKAEHFDQIQITYSSTNPELPQKVVEEIKNVYVRNTRERLTAMLHEVTRYFTNLADQMRDKRNHLEEDLLAFQSQYIGVDPTDPASLKLKITSLESEQAGLHRTAERLEREISLREHLLEQYKANRAGRARAAEIGPFPPEIAKGPEAQSIEREIRGLQDEIHELQITRRMTNQHPDIVDRRKRIARLQTALKSQYLQDVQSLPANSGVAIDEAGATAAVNAVTGWDAELARIQMDVQDRQGRLEAVQERVRTIDSDIERHSKLLENVFAHREEFMHKRDMINQVAKDYSAAMNRVTLVGSVLNADESEVGISFPELVAPTPCDRPSKPHSITVVVLSILAGVAAGALSVLLKELFDQTYRTTKQVTRSLGLGILESIDEIVTSVDRARRFRHNVLYAPAAVTLLLGAVTISCAAAYLSLQSPQTYEHMMRIPRSIWHKIHSSDNVAVLPAHNELPDAAPADNPAPPRPDSPALARADDQRLEHPVAFPD